MGRRTLEERLFEKESLLLQKEDRQRNQAQRMRSSLGKGKSRIRVGAAWALAAVVLCAHSCSAKLEVRVLPSPSLLRTNREGAALHQVGETVGATEKANVHTECYPSVDSTHTLADFDYQANGCSTAVPLYSCIELGLWVWIPLPGTREARNWSLNADTPRAEGSAT